MPRMKPDDLVKRRMWSALLKAAKRHHQTATDRGMVTQIARDAGVSKAAVSDWKNLGNYPEPATLRRLADLYGVSAEELSGYVEPSLMAARYDPASPDLARAIDLTERVIDRLKPDATLSEFADYARYANKLILQGMSDEEVQGHLFNRLDEDAGKGADD
jgi:transcriptional regulator with XRE-family HTH domain